MYMYILGKENIQAFESLLWVLRTITSTTKRLQNCGGGALRAAWKPQRMFYSWQALATPPPLHRICPCGTWRLSLIMPHCYAQASCHDHSTCTPKARKAMAYFWTLFSGCGPFSYLRFGCRYSLRKHTAKQAPSSHITPILFVIAGQANALLTSTDNLVPVYRKHELEK